MEGTVVILFFFYYLIRVSARVNKIDLIFLTLINSKVDDSKDHLHSHVCIKMIVEMIVFQAKY